MSSEFRRSRADAEKWAVPQLSAFMFGFHPLSKSYRVAEALDRPITVSLTCVPFSPHLVTA